MAALSAGLSAHGLRLRAAPRRESTPTHTLAGALERRADAAERSLGGASSHRRAAVPPGGDELHLPPPAVLHGRRQMLRRPGQQERRGFVGNRNAAASLIPPRSPTTFSFLCRRRSGRRNPEGEGEDLQGAGLLLLAAADAGLHAPRLGRTSAEFTQILKGVD